VTDGYVTVGWGGVGWGLQIDQQIDQQIKGNSVRTTVDVAPSVPYESTTFSTTSAEGGGVDLSIEPSGGEPAQLACWCPTSREEVRGASFS